MSETFPGKPGKPREFVPLEEVADKALNPEELLIRSQESEEDEAEDEMSDPVPFETRLKEAFERNPLQDTAALEEAMRNEAASGADEVEAKFDKLADADGFERSRKLADAKREREMIDPGRNAGRKPERPKGSETIRKEAA